MNKKFLGLIALAAISIQTAQAQPYYYPQQYPQNNNYYINNPQYRNERVQLSVNSPTNGSSFRGNFQLAGTGTPGAQVIVTGSMSGQTVVQPNGRWRLPMSLRGLAPGAVIHLNAFARDYYGNQSNVTRLKYAVSY